MALADAASTVRDVAFFSYSHLDRAEWLEKFLVLLKPYLRRGWLEIWADPHIPVGELWEREIASGLRRARVGVLLCSPDFAASDFIAEVELPELVAAAERGELQLFCIPVRAMDPEPLGLDAYQWARPPGQPLNGLSPHEREAAMVELVKQLVKMFRGEATARATAGRRAMAPRLEQPEQVAPLEHRAAGELGTLHGVPELPPHFVARTEAVQKVVKALLEEPHAHHGISASARAGLHGQGGLGKTVVAIALAHDAEVRGAFPDGIYWLTLGQEPDLVALQQSLALLVTGQQLGFDAVPLGASLLREKLKDGACLLVLDDVWQVEHARVFEVLGDRGRVLITTRDRALLDAFDARVQDLDFLEPGAARELLARWAAQPENALPPEVDAVARQCGYLPLALSLAGAQVRGGARWEDVLQALEEGDLRFLDHPYGSVFKSLSASVRALPAFEQERYRELAIFPEDTKVPAGVIIPLWGSAGMGLPATTKLLRSFANRALLTLSEEGGSQHVTFHDLQGDYLRLIVEEAPKVHRKLLAAHYRNLPTELEGPARWATLPAGEAYLWQHIVHHLLEAGERETLRALVCDARWLEAKVAASGVAGLLSALTLVVARDPSVAHRCIEQALRLESGWLHRHSEALPSLLYNRLRAAGMSREDIESTVAHLRLPVRLLHPVNMGGSDVRVLRGHSDSVRACAYSPDGRRLLSAAQDKTLREWDRHTGVELRRFDGHSDSVTACAYSPDGTRVLSASYDGTLREWDCDSGTELRRFEGHSRAVMACTYSHDGSRVLSASYDRTLREWDRDTATELRRFHGHSNAVTACTYSNDDRRLLSASHDWTLREWDRDTATELRRFQGHLTPVNDCAYSHDDRRVLSASDDHTLREWDRDTATELRRFHGHSNAVIACAYSHDDSRVLSASSDRTLREWDRDTGAELRRFDGHSNGVTACAYSHDDSRVLSASSDHTLREWDRDTATELRCFQGHSGAVTGCAYSHDGRHVLSASEDQTTKIWNRESGQCLETVYGTSSFRALSSTRGFLAAGDAQGNIWILQCDEL